MPAEAKPYKGSDSYQPEDADLFFGRDTDENRLVDRILTAPVTLLHAQSGAGKTSLLNARVFARLEAADALPVLIRLGNEPLASTRQAVLEQLIPAPGAERIALLRAAEQLECQRGTLEELFTRFDDLAPSDLRRWELLRPVAGQAVDLDGGGLPFDRVATHFCRALRGSLDLQRFEDELRAVAGGDGDGPGDGIRAQADMAVSELAEQLDRAELTQAHRALLADLFDPAPGMAPFFDHLCHRYGARIPGFTLVLMFDQFEELFTRFVDPGPLRSAAASALPDWHLRPQFIAELRGLYRALVPDERAGLAPLPVSVVLSMREDYTAQLDDIRGFVPELDRDAYHLRLLDVDEVHAAIVEPARMFGYRYGAECYVAMLQELSKEGRFVEPAHLQVVCEKLWERHGRELHERRTHDGEDDDAEIQLDDFMELGGVGGILADFFRDFLRTLDEADRLEVLLLLEPLITSGGTRNIADEASLIAVPFRDPARRTRLLRTLVDRTIVRIEPRLGQRFVEITHEFIIQPILDAMRRESQGQSVYWDLRNALSILQRCTNRGTDEPLRLTQAEFRIVARSARFLHPTRALAELLVRSALVHGVDADADIEAWAAQLDSLSTPSAEELVREGVIDRVDGRGAVAALARAEVRGEISALTPDEVAHVLGVALRTARPEDREFLAHWARRWGNT